MPDSENNYNPLNDTKLLDDINNAFIKKFKTDKFHYIYDVNTNEIVKVDKVIWNLFPDEISGKKDLSTLIQKWGSEAIERALLEIREQKQKDNLFSTNFPTVCMTLTQEELEKHIKHKNEQTLLNVTEECNFRCKYCIFSGIYKNVRTHSKKFMSWEIAKTAMNTFIKNSSEVKDPTFSFYGGEPLLAMDLIIKCVEYLENRNKPRFTVSTNGSLLNEENIKYLISKKFTIYISLDGPREIHDSYRVYSSGKGSWDDIIRNIDLIKKIDIEYYKEKVAFNCTMAPPYNINKCIMFFINEFPGFHVSLTLVDYENTEYFEKNFTYKELYEELYNQMDILYKEYINLYIHEDNYSSFSRLVSNLYDSFPADCHKRNKKILSNVILAQGQCFMGARKLFCDTDGNYYPCERVNGYYNIGSVFSGVDYDKIYKYMNKFNTLQTDKCNKCPYIRFCKKCIREIYGNEKFNKKHYYSICANKKININEKFIQYMSMMEKNPKSMDKVASIVFK